MTKINQIYLMVIETLKQSVRKVKKLLLVIKGLDMYWS